MTTRQVEREMEEYITKGNMVIKLVNSGAGALNAGRVYSGSYKTGVFRVHVRVRVKYGQMYFIFASFRST